MQIIWIVIEIVLVQILATVNWGYTNWFINVSGFLLCVSSSGTYMVWRPLKLHFELVSWNMTLKEKVSRLKIMPMEYTDDPKTNISCYRKRRNLRKFFCCRDIPPSEL